VVWITLYILRPFNVYSHSTVFAGELLAVYTPPQPISSCELSIGGSSVILALEGSPVISALELIGPGTEPITETEDYGDAAHKGQIFDAMEGAEGR